MWCLLLCLLHHLDIAQSTYIAYINFAQNHVFGALLLVPSYNLSNEPYENEACFGKCKCFTNSALSLTFLNATNMRPFSSALLVSPTQVNIVLIARQGTSFCCDFLYLQHFKGLAGPAIIRMGGSQASSSSRLNRDRPVLGSDRCLVPTSSGDGKDRKAVALPLRPPVLLLFVGVGVVVSGLRSLCSRRRRPPAGVVSPVLEPTSGLWSRLGLSDVDTVFSGALETEAL